MINESCKSKWESVVLNLNLGSQQPFDFLVGVGGGGYWLFWEQKVCLQFLDKKTICFWPWQKKIFVLPSAAMKWNAKIEKEELFSTCLEKNYVLSDAAKYFTRKLAPSYVGPFYIHKRLSPWTYELRDAEGNSKGVWHTKDLKPGPDD